MKLTISAMLLFTSISSIASDTIPFPTTYKMLKSAFDLGLKKVICPDEKLGNLNGEIRYADDTKLQLVFFQSIAGHKVETVLHRNWPLYSETEVRQGSSPQKAFEQYSKLFSDQSLMKTISNTSDEFDLIVGQTDGTFVVSFKKAAVSTQRIPHCSQYNSSARGCWYEEIPILNTYLFKDSPRELYTNCHVEDGGIHTLQEHD